MGGFDRYDRIKEHGAGFHSKSHIYKWYKKAYWITLDFMCLNSFISWNILT